MKFAWWKENSWKNLLLLLMKGGNALALGSIDGVSHWKTLMHDMPSMRSHTLHNVDDVWGYAALRKDNWKLVKGFFSIFSLVPSVIVTFSLMILGYRKRNDVRWPMG